MCHTSLQLFVHLIFLRRDNSFRLKVLFPVEALTFSLLALLISLCCQLWLDRLDAIRHFRCRLLLHLGGALFNHHYFVLWHRDSKAVFVFDQHNASLTETSDFTATHIVQKSYFITNFHNGSCFWYAKVRKMWEEWKKYDNFASFFVRKMSFEGWFWFLCTHIIIMCNEEELL